MDEELKPTGEWPYVRYRDEDQWTEAEGLVIPDPPKGDPYVPLQVAYPERLLGKSVPVLDHGFVRLESYMGGDEGVVRSARISYQKDTRSYREDRGLIRYLMRKRHTSPSEHTLFTFHIKWPIFVARQGMRHRAGAWNEQSARYSVMEEEYHSPEPGGFRHQDGKNRQAGGEPFSDDEGARFAGLMEGRYHDSHALYEELLGEGLARETAREVLPVALYTQVYWTVSLHNLLHFIELRADPHAQAEIRAYAGALEGFVRLLCPLSWEAFRDFRKEALTLSGPEVRAIRRLLSGEPFDPAHMPGKSEFEELLAKLDLLGIERPS
jgi:thymidylate synthase (FAD)